MTIQHYPNLDPLAFGATRDALHAYARILGAWASACRPKRKHWWHASLRPSLNGLTTEVIRADVDFELELNLREGLLQGQTSSGEEFKEDLHGQPAAELALMIQDFLIAAGIDDRITPEGGQRSAKGFDGYSAEQAYILSRAVNSVTTAMERFRAGIREESSPIQLWPHHFDLAMLWLPGDKVPDQDPENEESADKQMNFGFTFGDEGITEPYFYVTAYPFAEALSVLQLPVGTTWHTGGFSGAVLLYRSLIQNTDPNTYLLNLWNRLLSAGREHTLANATRGHMQ